MQFEELEEKIVQNAKSYGERYQIKIDQQFALLKLIEEVGEFAEAVLTYDRKSRPEKLLTEADAKAKLAIELADIVGMAIVNANIFSIDLEEAIIKKWIDK